MHAWTLALLVAVGQLTDNVDVRKRLEAMSIDEEAKAAGIPWQEWVRKSPEERASAVEGKVVQTGWRCMDVTLEIRPGRSLVHARELDSTGIDVDPETLSLASWLFFERALLRQDAPEWGIKVYVLYAGDPSEAERLVARCEGLGFDAVAQEAVSDLK